MRLQAWSPSGASDAENGLKRKPATVSVKTMNATARLFHSDGHHDAFERLACGKAVQGLRGIREKIKEINFD